MFGFLRRIRDLEIQVEQLQLALQNARPRCLYLGRDIGMTVLHSGQTLFVDTRDRTMAPHLLRDGFWERWVEAAFVSEIKPGMTVLDVGASFGYFTLAAARCVGAHGKVIAVEPNPEIAPLLRHSVEANGLWDIVTIHAVAAHSRPGTAMLNVATSTVGGGSVHRSREDVFWGYCNVEVPAARLDTLLPASTRIDVIKLDIEEGEFDAFAGMGALLDHPRAVIAEFRAAAVDRFQPSLDYLKGFATRGFSLHVVEPEGVTAAMTPGAVLAHCGHRLVNLLFRR